MGDEYLQKFNSGKERDYYKLVCDALYNGIITEDERLILDKRRVKYELTDEKASEIENLAKKEYYNLDNNPLIKNDIADAKYRGIINKTELRKFYIPISKKTAFETIEAFLPLILAIVYTFSAIDLIKTSSNEEVFFIILGTLYLVNNMFTLRKTTYFIINSIILTLGGIPLLLIFMLDLFGSTVIKIPILGTLIKNGLEIFRIY